jgi:SAM domain (Sterile alpha motif)
MWAAAVLLLFALGAVANALEHGRTPAKPMQIWTEEDAAAFVRAIGPAYAGYADKLLAASIDGRALRGMTDAILADTGVADSLHRHRILSAIAAQP